MAVVLGEALPDLHIPPGVPSPKAYNLDNTKVSAHLGSVVPCVVCASARAVCLSVCMRTGPL